MPSQRTTAASLKTTAGRFKALVALILATVALVGCGSDKKAGLEHAEEEEAEARTGFTDRIENFFEYDLAFVAWV